MPVRVVTDSASDLPAELIARHEITVVPLDVRLGDYDVAEMRRIDPAEFWRRAGASDALAETSAPSPGAFRDAFLAARAQGCDGAVCVTISSRLSATYQAASAGATEVGDAIAVEVVDSRFATMGEGLLVLEAAERAARGETAAQIARGVREAIADVATLGTLDTLDFLRRGGRIGTAQALVGSLLSIKPVVEVRDGAVEGESRQRTRARSFRYLADKVAALAPVKRLAVVHAAAPDLGEFLALLAELDLGVEPIVSYIGPVIGAHTGPGTVGVCVQRA